MNSPVITEKMVKSGRRIFVEYPVAVHGLEFEEPARTIFERTVITSEKLGRPDAARLLVSTGKKLRGAIVGIRQSGRISERAARSFRIQQFY